MDTDSKLMELPFQLLVFSFKQLLKQKEIELLKQKGDDEYNYT